MNFLADKIYNKIIGLSHGAKFKYTFASVFPTNTKYHIRVKIPMKTTFYGQVCINFSHGRHSSRSNKWCCANMLMRHVDQRHTKSAICDI